MNKQNENHSVIFLVHQTPFTFNREDESNNRAQRDWTWPKINKSIHFKPKIISKVNIKFIEKQNNNLNDDDIINKNLNLRFHLQPIAAIICTHIHIKNK